MSVVRQRINPWPPSVVSSAHPKRNLQARPENSCSATRTSNWAPVQIAGWGHVAVRKLWPAACYACRVWGPLWNASVNREFTSPGTVHMQRPTSLPLPAHRLMPFSAPNSPVRYHQSIDARDDAAWYTADKGTYESTIMPQTVVTPESVRLLRPPAMRTAPTIPTATNAPAAPAGQSV